MHSCVLLSDRACSHNEGVAAEKRKREKEKKEEEENAKKAKAEEDFDTWGVEDTEDWGQDWEENAKASLKRASS